MGSKRIEWIDIAKGICIALVVSQHISAIVELNNPVSMYLWTFLMPLYFILSGLFFKQYDGFADFMKRKVNKLLIPFLFFYIVTSSGPFWLLHHRTEWTNFYEYGPVYNLPIWFLLCLFEVNVLFYLVQWVAAFAHGRVKAGIALALTIACGIAGLMMCVYDINLPFFLDTALTVVPFFAFGWWLRNRTKFLDLATNLYRDVPLLVGCGLIAWLLGTPLEYLTNTFTLDGIWFIYITGIAGTLMVLTLSRIINHFALLAYWGRYSIMILCAHFLLLLVLIPLFKRYFTGGALYVAVFVVTMAVCHFLIPVMKRFLPHVTAQKDVIKVND